MSVDACDQTEAIRLSRTVLSVAVAAVNRVHADRNVDGKVQVAREKSMVTCQHS